MHTRKAFRCTIKMRNRTRVNFLNSATVILLVVVSVCSAQCKTGEKGKAVDEQNRLPDEHIMADTLKTSTLNSDKTMELRVSKVFHKGDPAAQLNYAVYMRATDSLVKEGQHRGMHVEWNDDSSIKIIPYVGMEQKPQSENPLENTKKQIQNDPIIIKLKKNHE